MDKVLWSLNGVIQIMQTAQTCEMYDKKHKIYFLYQPTTRKIFYRDEQQEKMELYEQTNRKFLVALRNFATRIYMNITK